MAKMYDRAMFVLGHAGTRSELRAVLCNKLTCRYVLIFQIARVSLPMGLSQIRVPDVARYTQRWQEANEMEGILGT